MNQEQKSRSRTFSWEDPTELAQAGKKLSGLAFLQAIQAGELPPPPSAALIGFAMQEVSEGRALFTFNPAEFHYNPLGSVHGGVMATLLDTAMGCAVQSMLKVGQWYTTVEIKVNYLRPLTESVGTVYGEGKVLHLGGRTAIAEGRVTDNEGKYYAHATTTCLLLRP